MTAAVKLEVKNLEFSYQNGHRALKNINMQIRDKTVTAFIGPSGCGKSTLLRTFNRMYDLYPGQRAAGQDGCDNAGQADGHHEQMVAGAVELKDRGCDAGKRHGRRADCGGAKDCDDKKTEKHQERHHPCAIGHGKAAVIGPPGCSAECRRGCGLRN